MNGKKDKLHKRFMNAHRGTATISLVGGGFFFLLLVIKNDFPRYKDVIKHT